MITVYYNLTVVGEALLKDPPDSHPLSNRWWRHRLKLWLTSSPTWMMTSLAMTPWSRAWPRVTHRLYTADRQQRGLGQRWILPDGRRTLTDPQTSREVRKGQVPAMSGATGVQQRAAGWVNFDSLKHQFSLMLQLFTSMIVILLAGFVPETKGAHGQFSGPGSQRSWPPRAGGWRSGWGGGWRWGGLWYGQQSVSAIETGAQVRPLLK